MVKTWEVRPGGKSNFSSLEQIKNLLLKQRGVMKSKAVDYFTPQIDAGMHDPYLMVGMKKAVDRIFKAIKEGEQILVYGDYDVDGVSSTAIVMLTLSALGAKAVPFLPHRTENGYGLDGKVLRDLLGQFDLLVTVDCGISNSKEVSWLAKQGKDSIVTDHHLMPEKMPPAWAVLHPNHPKGSYPFKYLCGAGVSWKLAMALLADQRAGRGSDQEQIFNLLGLACLGTVADMVPLVGENRVIVKYGLRALGATKNPGLMALVAAAGVSRTGLTVESIAFRMAPLINAAGRIDHPQAALDLLLAPSVKVAEEKMAKLQKLNLERRRVGQIVEKEAEIAGVNGGSVIVAANMNWPAGVLGLVAGRLCDKYRRPAMVIGGGSGVAIGSARAPQGVNIIEVLGVVSDLLTRYGGHEAAAGFTLPQENIKQVQEVLLAKDIDWKPSQVEIRGEADLILSPQLLGWNLIDLLEQMEPFGQGNERPMFILQNVYLGQWMPVGKTQKHAKLILNVNDELLEGIAFGLVEELESSRIKANEMIDVLGYLEVNDFRGRRSLQMNIKDVGRAGEISIIDKQ